jgi:hypothetical protein
VSPGKIDRPDRAERHAELAALASKRIDLKAAVGFGNRAETAKVCALAAGFASRKIDPGLVSGEKRLDGLDLWPQDQVKVRRVHIQVTDDPVFCQVGKGGGKGGLPGAPFSADADNFLHAVTCPAQTA